MSNSTENLKILRRFDGCNTAICLASNQMYLPYAAVTIYSILHHGNKDRYYDILLLSKELSQESKDALQEIGARYPNASIRIVDMQQWSEKLNVHISSYYSEETNYRLFLLSDLFSDYKKIIYIDCDIIVAQDILLLEEEDMHGYPLAACRDYSMYLKQYVKGAVFFNNEPGTVEHYCQTVLGLDGFKDYFNAGVLVFDKEKCRQEGTDASVAIEKLQEENWTYNDQDVLNMLFAGKVCYLDVRWNYIYEYDRYYSYPDVVRHNLYQKVHRERPAMVHYIGGRKPWSHAPLALEHMFWNEVKALEENIPVWKGRYPRPEKKVNKSSLLLRTPRRK